MKHLIALSALLLLAGCQTLSPDQIAAQDDAQCLGYGTPRGSDGYVLCRMQLSQQRHEDDQLRSAELATMGAKLKAQ